MLMENQEQPPIQSQMPVQPISEPVQSPIIEPKKSFPKWPLIIVGVILITVLLTGTYFLGQKLNNKVACTTEAKLCPNGSSVGRAGPKCEFSPCPKTPTPTPDPTANWKTYTGADFTIKYPADYSVIPSSYVSSSNYPNGSLVTFQSTTSAITITESDNSRHLTTANALGNGPGLSYTKDFLTGKIIQSFFVDAVAGVGVENIAAGQSGTEFDTIWINNGKIYQATTSTKDGYAALKQMLSTFKFANQTAQTQEVWSSICDTKFKEPFTISVKQGDSQTTIARAALVSYFAALALADFTQQQPLLSAAENVYAEDYIIKNFQIGQNTVGSKVAIPCNIVEDSALRARLLTVSQKENLQQYSNKVTDLTTRELINKIIEENSSKSLPFKIINLN
jgi:hypothetical protein